MEVTRLVDDVENDADSKSKGKKTGYACYLHGQQLSGIGCWSIL